MMTISLSAGWFMSCLHSKSPMRCRERSQCPLQTGDSKLMTNSFIPNRDQRYFSAKITFFPILMSGLSVYRNRLSRLGSMMATLFHLIQGSLATLPQTTQGGLDQKATRLIQSNTSCGMSHGSSVTGRPFPGMTTCSKVMGSTK